VDQNDKAIINHSLVTAVIGPDGTVKKILAGNRWTVDELVRDLEETVR
jgi:cytochrome oxidase Cu insertion factor (SCO1/SenC/PrrC family)